MSRTIEAIIKHTGATSEKKSASATSQAMKAIRIHNYGGPEVLHYEDAPRPKPQAGGGLIPVPAGRGKPIGLKDWERDIKKILPPKIPPHSWWDFLGGGGKKGARPAARGGVRK